MVVAFFAAIFYHMERDAYKERKMHISLITVTVLAITSLILSALCVSKVYEADMTIKNQIQMYEDLEYIKECVRDGANYVSRFDTTSQVQELYFERENLDLQYGLVITVLSMTSLITLTGILFLIFDFIETKYLHKINGILNKVKT